LIVNVIKEGKSLKYKNKRVLFVYPDCSPELPESKATVQIIESLRGKYDIAAYCNLDGKIIEADKKFSAMVTHVPYSEASLNSRPCAVSHFMRESIETTAA
jgi:cytosine/adenosine deaminase-related metal-dependent hydrolase